MKTKNVKLKLKLKEDVNANQIALVSNLFIITGTFIILAAMIYMLISLGKADLIITMWIPFIIIGILFIGVGLLFGFKKIDIRTKGYHLKEIEKLSKYYKR